MFSNSWNHAIIIYLFIFVYRYFYLQTEINFGKDIADGNWHFVVFTVNTDTNKVQFYLDGTAIGIAR